MHVKCIICNEFFTANKYLDTHVRFKHNNVRNVDRVDLGKERERTEGTHSFPNNEVPLNDNDGRAEPRKLPAKKIENRRGQNQRKSYTVEFKLKTLEFLDFFTELKVKKKWEKVAKEKGASKSLVIKWNKNREKLKKELALSQQNRNMGSLKATRHRRKLVGEKVNNICEKYLLAAKRVVLEFNLRRAKGCKVSKLWIKKKMKAKIEACYGKEAADKFKASDTCFQRFKKRHKISFRRRWNKKKNSTDDARETIQRFHQNLRKAVRRRNGSATNAKYGRWLPRNRYNIDQVPLPFVIDQDKTYDFTGNKQVWVSQLSTGLDKRQATLQLCIRAEGEQNVKPALAFRGKGNVSTAERAEYGKGVNVYFQECAWMDSKINMEWVSRTLVAGIGRDTQEEKVIFAGNVGFPQEKQFHKACRKDMDAVIYLLPQNHTDKFQPVDVGCGRLVKAKIGEAVERWLEEDDNLELWHDKVSARTRRILMSKWTAEAWKELSADTQLFKKLFQKTGCLITADGSDDDHIKRQALEGYTF